MTAKATRAFAELQRKAYAYLQTSKLSVWIGIVMAVVFVKTSCSRSAIERDPLSRWAVATKTAFSYFRNLMTGPARVPFRDHQRGRWTRLPGWSRKASTRWVGLVSNLPDTLRPVGREPPLLAGSDRAAQAATGNLG